MANNILGVGVSVPVAHPNYADLGESIDRGLAAGVPSLMDYPTVSALAGVYSRQIRVDRSTWGSLQAMMAPGAFREDNLPSTLQAALTVVVDMIYAEEELLTAYDAWLDFRGGDDG